MKQPLSVALLPIVLDLYDRLAPGIRERLSRLSEGLAEELKSDDMEVTVGPVASQTGEASDAIGGFQKAEVDLVVVVLYCYAPSGQINPALMNSGLPFLLWPVQVFSRLEPDKYNDEQVLYSHGVHGVQDLANVLRRKGVPFGMLHGQLSQEGVREDLVEWVRAGRVLGKMRKANPIVLGGAFPDMLDLQIGDESFLKNLASSCKTINLDEFCDAGQDIKETAVAEVVEEYIADFNVADDLNRSILQKTARHDLALRGLMHRYESNAIGVNFLTLCNDQRILDPLHLPVSRLMAEGIGYGAEGDWVTASFLRGFMAAAELTSFTEIFSVGYEDNRLVLKHWGEGNYRLSREKPSLVKSSIKDRAEAVFPMVHFEFLPGPALLVNLNTTVEGVGQLISISGEIDEDHLPVAQGPRGIFRPGCGNVRTLLDSYARNGGSHHLVLVRNGRSSLIDKMADLSGWVHISL